MGKPDDNNTKGSSNNTAAPTNPVSGTNPAHAGAPRKKSGKAHPHGFSSTDTSSPSRKISKASGCSVSCVEYLQNQETGSNFQASAVPVQATQPVVTYWQDPPKLAVVARRPDDQQWPDPKSRCSFVGVAGTPSTKEAEDSLIGDHTVEEVNTLSTGTAHSITQAHGPAVCYRQDS